MKLVNIIAYLLGIVGYCWAEHVMTDGTGFPICSLHLKSKTWKAAKDDCENAGKFLLCYNSKIDIEKILKAFQMDDGRSKLRLWLSSRTCKPDKEIAQCLIVSIHRSGKTVAHYFERNCHAKLPFICCPKDEIDPPKSSTSLQKTTTTISSSLATVTTPHSESSKITSITPSISQEHSTVPASTPPMAEISTSMVSKRDDNTTSMISTITEISSTPIISYCKAIRKRGVLWPQIPAGSTVSRPCPGNSRGNATWYCSRISYDWSPIGPNMSQCHSKELEYLREKFEDMTAEESVDILTTLYKDDETLQGNDLVDSVDLIARLPDRLFQEAFRLPENVRYTFATDTVTKTTAIFDKMIQSDVWIDVPREQMPGVGSQMLSSVDSFGLLLAKTMTNETTKCSIVKDTIMLEITTENDGGTKEFPKNGHKYEKDGKITLFNGYSEQFDRRKGPVSIVYVFYSDMNNILVSTRRTETLNSPVVSVSISQRSLQPTSIHAKVHVFVEHHDSTNVSTCVFWNLNTDMWDNAGCELVDFNATHSLCACDHLTNFAVLMDFSGTITDMDSKPLYFITIIGCSLSIISLAICITIFTFYRYQERNSHNVRYSIHRNLCITLCLANVLLLAGLNRTEHQLICAIVAGFLHYLFLSAFSWMLLEGVHIYFLLVVVFASKKTHWQKYYLFGYGFPLIVVGITVASRPNNYGTPDRCWLSTENESMWSFAGPVACILLLNTAALILAQYKASRISVKNDKVSLVKRWLRVTLILFPILGLTWGLGFLCVGEYATVMSNVFAFLNSLQGFCIFICHCVLDKKVRTMVTTSIRKKQATVTTGSGDSKRTMKRASAQFNTTKTSSEGGRATKLTFGSGLRNKWNQFKMPWAFCFTLDILNRTSSSIREEQEKLPNAVIMHCNNFNAIKAQ